MVVHIAKKPDVNLHHAWTLIVLTTNLGGARG